MAAAAVAASAACRATGPASSESDMRQLSAGPRAAGFGADHDISCEALCSATRGISFIPRGNLFRHPRQHHSPRAPAATGKPGSGAPLPRHAAGALPDQPCVLRSPHSVGGVAGCDPSGHWTSPCRTSNSRRCPQRGHGRLWRAGHQAVFPGSGAYHRRRRPVGYRPPRGRRRDGVAPVGCAPGLGAHCLSRSRQLAVHAGRRRPVRVGQRHRRHGWRRHGH